MRETTALIYSPKMTTKFSFKLDNINISFSMSAGGSLKNVTLEWGGLADVIRGGGKICQNLADVICERSLTLNISYHGLFGTLAREIDADIVWRQSA